jgi:hypothetical protein
VSQCDRQRVGQPQRVKRKFLNGGVNPPYDVLVGVPGVTGVSLSWLMLEEGPMERPSAEAGRRIPILGRVPAGPPGGGAWDVYDAPDVYDTFDDDREPGHAIALRVMG